jgi:hypothetical protein
LVICTFRITAAFIAHEAFIAVFIDHTLNTTLALETILAHLTVSIFDTL